MPQFTYTQSVGAGATYDPLTGWQYERIPVAAVIQVLHNATAVGVVATVVSGSDQLLDESPVPAGGTAGVIPSSQTVDPLIDQVAPGDKIRIRYRNTTGGAVTVNGVIRF